jgi:CRP/FNR family transcriptional regulator, cyclic AMP receptor protein
MRKVLYILGELSDTDTEWLITTGRKEQLSAGDVLIYQDRPIDAVYIVLDGSLSVGTGRGGREIARLGAGEMVGEMSFVDARPPSATVTALEQSIVLAIPRPRLVSKLEQDAGFAARFYRALAIFLSNRLRGMVSQFGYGREQQAAADSADELDANVLDNVYLAGSRFDHLLKRLLAS